MPEAAVPAHSEVSVPGDSDSDYSLIRSWTFCDDCGNCDGETQTVTVTDTTPPVVVGPDDETVEYPHIPPQYEGQITATDDCSYVTAECTEERVDGDCDYEYQLVRTCTATDPTGNSGTEVTTISVQDTTPPVIHGVPANVTVEYGSVPPLEDALDHVMATDNSGGQINLTVSETRINGDNDHEYV